MDAVNQEDIKARLDKALATQGSLICILHDGLPESQHIYDQNPVLYTQIEFHPYSFYEGYYSGLMFYPSGKAQGLMDFTVMSFKSVAYLEEA